MQSTTILCKYFRHANVLTYFTYAETFVVNSYLFKYFRYAKGYDNTRLMALIMPKIAAKNFSPKFHCMYAHLYALLECSRLTLITQQTTVDII